MKKIIPITLCIVLIFSLVGCISSKKGGDYPATINVNGTNYHSTGNAVLPEVDDNLIEYTTSYAENGVPAKDGETNFSRDAGTPYAVLENETVVVLIDNKWIEFKKN